jgi:2'-5' RNA ligase
MWSSPTDEQYRLPGLDNAPANCVLFFALFPDRPAAADARQTAEHLRRSYGLRGMPIDAGRLHVSLHGIGRYARLPNDVVAKACAAAAEISAEPFCIRFDHTVSFAAKRGKRPLVLVADALPAPLFALRRRLGDALARKGLRNRAASSFTPHMTLLYDAHPVEPCAIQPVIWTARELVLVHSRHGSAEHVWLGRWPLRGSPST